jgi:hypothetical protein
MLLHLYLFLFFYLLDRINRRKSGHDYLIGSRTVSRFFFSHLLLFKCENNVPTKKKKEDNEHHHSSFVTKKQTEKNVGN